jgi:cysteine desulfurase
MATLNHRLPNVTNIGFKGVDNEGLLMGINKEIAVSSGSACTICFTGTFLCAESIGRGDESGKKFDYVLAWAVYYR